MDDEPPFEPWKRRAATAADVRRHELFARASVVFRRHGFRGAAVKALAHACGLAPAGLYHYFGSKRELATYPLDHPRLDWATTYVDERVDPLVQLRQLVDLSIRELPTYLLALQLAEEIEGRPDQRLRGRAFGEGEAVFGRFLMAVDPTMERGRAARWPDTSLRCSRDQPSPVWPSPMTRCGAEWWRSCARHSCRLSFLPAGSRRRCGAEQLPKKAMRPFGRARGRLHPTFTDPTRCLMLARPIIPSFMTLTVAMVLSWGGMLAHNMYELPIAVLDALGPRAALTGCS